MACHMCGEESVATCSVCGGRVCKKHLHAKVKWLELVPVGLAGVVMGYVVHVATSLVGGHCAGCCPEKEETQGSDPVEDFLRNV